MQPRASRLRAACAPRCGSGSTPRCRRSVPSCRDLVTDSGAVPGMLEQARLHLGRPIARGSAFRSRTIPAPASCRCRRSPIRRPTSARAPRCATTTSPRKLVHAFKYGDRLDLAPMLGRWMARAGQDLFADADALVPVPLHWRRLWARRFNQSAALAEADRARERHRRSRTRRSSASSATAQQVGLSRKRARHQRAGRIPRRRPTARPRSPAAV